MNLPSHRFPRFVGRNEPWAQSWKTMKVRSRNPAAGIARARVTQGEISMLRYIATVSAKYGATEVARSRRLRRSEGCSWAAIDSRQTCRPESRSGIGAAGTSWEIVVTGFNVPIFA